jgi:MoxR-like ATPase
LGQARRDIRLQLARRVVGLDEVIDHVLIALFSGGHCLLVGVPGLAKTLLISSLAELLHLDFSRIQFTPDLMPSDITGAEVLVDDRTGGERHFEFLRGPIFANLILADEINRTPPKTQAALLEAMEERQVTSVGRKQQLAPPFFVLATQNPIEQEGTYPLPVSQMDRFMFLLEVGYPTEEQEYRIVRLTISRKAPALERVLERQQILQLIHAVRQLEVADPIIDYAVRLTRAARPGDASSMARVNENVRWGPGPRATQHLLMGAKACALLDGRTQVLASDIRAVVPACFRHRLLIHYHAEVDGETPAAIIETLLADVPAPDRDQPHTSSRPKTITSRT